MYGDSGLSKTSAVRPGFLHATVLEHDDLVGAFGGDREVVRDQQQADAQRGLQFAEQVEDALLDRDVQRARRLVGDEELRLREHRESDEHALQHPAGKLVRVGVVHAPRVGQADAVEGVEDRFALCARAVDAGEHGGLVRLGSDRAHRVERVRGVLRHEPDLTAPQRPEAGSGRRGSRSRRR